MKLLTGKCEKDFKGWFLLHNGYLSLSDMFYDEFTEMPVSMQWGVIQDFAISNSYELFIKYDGNDYICFAGVSVNTFYIGMRETCAEARETGIKHFNKLYNEKH